MKKTIFDIGMYDGSDTAYYLESGYRVVAVEANPSLVENALLKFGPQIQCGSLICINAAISENGQSVELFLSNSDLGSSSLYEERLVAKRCHGAIQIPGITLAALLEQYGVPEYLKVDIEGADRLCVLSLTVDKRPSFVSFEAGNDAVELTQHLESIGFKHFKIIHQGLFLELATQRRFIGKCVRRLARVFRKDAPRTVKRGGRQFIRGHSSGPLPWLTDGKWRSGQATCSRLTLLEQSHTLSAGYDVHAAVNTSIG